MPANPDLKPVKRPLQALPHLQPSPLRALGAAIVLFAGLAAASCAPEVEPKTFAELEYPVPTRDLTLSDGTRIAYADQGKGGRTLLMIHGLGSYLPAWSRTIPDLSRSHRVVAIDLPGYGKSDKNLPEHTLPVFRDVVIEVLDSLGVERAVVVGHSMGAQIAILTALDHPGRVEALVLAAPAGLERFTTEDREWFSTYISPAAIRMVPALLVERQVKLNFHTFPEQARFMVEDRIAVMDDPAFADYARAQSESVFSMLDTPVADRLGELDIPVLMVFGRQDALIPNTTLHPGLTLDSLLGQARAAIPGLQIELVDPAGHLVQFERPDAVNPLILQFLDGLPASSGQP